MSTVYATAQFHILYIMNLRFGAARMEDEELQPQLWGYVL